VFVNGGLVAADGTLTDAAPGTVLHSGRDTETVTLAAVGRARPGV
jgi:hypothetical protein